MSSDGDRIFHLATPDAWAAAQADGQLRPPSLAVEGFIHCSTAGQVAGTIERHFAGVDELLALELDDAIHAELQWDESRPGEHYPHLYRPLLVGEIVRAVPWHRSADGSVAFPT